MAITRFICRAVKVSQRALSRLEGARRLAGVVTAECELVQIFGTGTGTGAHQSGEFVELSAGPNTP